MNKKVESEFDKLALAIAKKAIDKDTPLQEQIDALKVLTPYYNARTKGKKGTDEDESDGDDFDAFADKLKAVSEGVNGGTEQAVRGSSRRRLS